MLVFTSTEKEREGKKKNKNSKYGLLKGTGVGCFCPYNFRLRMNCEKEGNVCVIQNVPAYVMWIYVKDKSMSRRRKAHSRAYCV
jgi:hypothetical protein